MKTRDELRQKARECDTLAAYETWLLTLTPDERAEHFAAVLETMTELATAIAAALEPAMAALLKVADSMRLILEPYLPPKEPAAPIPTPEEFAATIRVIPGTSNHWGDAEHREADDAVCNLLRQLGYAEAASLIDDTDRWFS